MTRTICYLPDSARRILILTNPAAGAQSGRSLVTELTRRLEADGFDVETHADLDTLGETVGVPSETQVRAVVAAGGDGTIAAAVNSTHPDTPLAVLPLGTENLLAKYLEYSPNPAHLTHMIAHGATVKLDAGLAGDRLFLLMTGCGFDAEVVRRLHAGRRGHIRHLSYAKPIVDSIRTYKYPELRVYCEPIEESSGAVDEPGGSEEAIVARWLFVVNLPGYAAGLKLVPHAVGTDGLLDVCAFKHGSFLGGLRYLSGIVRGRHLDWSDCSVLRTRRVRIESDEEVPYQLDGDPGGIIPLEITAIPNRVRIIVTESWALRHGFRHRCPSDLS